MTSKDTIDTSKIRGAVLAEGTYTFDKMGSILYALGIGFSKDPMHRDHFKFTYENEEGFTTFPTMPVLMLSGAIDKLFSIPGMPAFNPMMLLHGEQTVINYKPITPGETLKIKAIATDIADKGKGALLTVTIQALSDKGEKYSDAIFRFFIRGLGGFGDKGVDTAQTIPAIPKRKPDFTIEDTTTANQALIYRLCGDINPLHIDPNMAAMGGFDKPILHGLCSYGIATRLVYDKYCNNDPTLIKSVSARFTSHVFPGETLKIKAIATDIADKGKGALLTVTIQALSDKGEKYSDAIF